MHRARIALNTNPRTTGKTIPMTKLTFLAVALTAIALVQPARAEIFDAADIEEMRAFRVARGSVTTPAQQSAEPASPSAQLAKIGATCADLPAPAGRGVFRFESK